MKILPTISLCLLALVITGCASGSAAGKRSGPKIVEVFACGNYCPGPRERYLKRVYKGVSDMNECRALGGRPYTYMGWDEKTICLAV